MKFCPEIEGFIERVVGDGVLGFFERKLIISDQEVRVFTPVYPKKTKPKGFVN